MINYKYLDINKENIKKVLLRNMIIVVSWFTTCLIENIKSYNYLSLYTLYTYRRWID